MNVIGKIGYIFIGVGIGLFGSSYILEHEFNKATGEIEEYIPREDRESNDIFDSEKRSKDSVKGSSEDCQDGEKDISSRRGGGEGSRRGNSEGGQREGGSHAEFESAQADLHNFYQSAEEYIHVPGGGRRKASEVDASRNSKESDLRRKEFEERRAEEIINQKKRYSKMYSGVDSSPSTSDVSDILHSVNEKTNTRESWNDGTVDHPIDDEPEDIPPYEVDIHDEYNLERIEGEFEIFLDDNPQEFTTLTYFSGDYTLCDDGDQIIPNPEEVVGMAALNRLMVGGPGTFNNVIFVHNLRTGLNYEVVLVPLKYSETVAGIYENDMNDSSRLRDIRRRGGDVNS